MAEKQHFKQGERILFGIAIVFVVAAVIGYIAMESYRAHSSKPIFVSKVHYNPSPLGLKGSVFFRKSGCTSCHRALRNGTNMGLSLDGVGSRRSKEWLYRFLRDPTDTYGSQTVDHGYPPKEAAYVSSLPKEKLMAIAAFISELKADQGSSSAPRPPTGRSEFIDDMVGAFAPEGWKKKYRDVREQDKQTPQGGKAQ